MKTEKVNITIEFCILELVYVPNFNLNKVLNFEANASQKGYSLVENGKSEHRHLILLIQISLSN